MPPETPAQLPLEALERIDAACMRFEHAWRGEGRPDLLDFLDGSGEERRALGRALLAIKLERRHTRGERPADDEYRTRLPGDDVDAVFADFGREFPPAPGATVALAKRRSGPKARPNLDVPGYAVLARLGVGGMGVVYKAKDVRLGRVVALKMIRSGDQASDVELARFRTEALAAARLSHPNIVQVFEVGEANGQPFLCMEYVEGDSLAHRINGTPWLADQAARLVETLARAIDAAHLAGVVHRDLKPPNVLLSYSRDAAAARSAARSAAASRLYEAVPKITDFGLAKLFEGDQGNTATGTFLGSPSYAAPEQAGAGRAAIDRTPTSTPSGPSCTNC